MSFLASLALSPATSAAPVRDDPLLRPIEADYAARRFLTPAPPVHVFGNTSLVGFGGLSVAVIRTSAGLILIDGALPQSVRDVEAHLRALGLSIRDVKLILSTEPHYDHAAGIAALERDSGATVLAGAAAVKTLRAGGLDPGDPQGAMLDRFPAPRKLRAVSDGQRIHLGGVTVTAVALPGHTPGSMGWRWRSCEGNHCANIVFTASINAVSTDDYRFTRHPELVATFRASMAKLRALPCDIVLTSHPDNSDGDRKLAAFLKNPHPNPWLDGDGCKKAADGFEARLNDRLAKEAKP
ncbi:MAG: subclass B3 metallo-beta-lactamase [Sphingomonadales bacterium]|nr:subclass B3 metallo-beta-lactamase [Sphingomonadales bacterium]MDE2168230.1 subclass B3 metallo-beta-lactamase [Sphingomonadales bacterium]